MCMQRRIFTQDSRSGNVRNIGMRGAFLEPVMPRFVEVASTVLLLFRPQLPSLSLLPRLFLRRWPSVFRAIPLVDPSVGGRCILASFRSGLLPKRCICRFGPLTSFGPRRTAPEFRAIPLVEPSVGGCCIQASCRSRFLPKCSIGCLGPLTSFRHGRTAPELSAIPLVEPTLACLSGHQTIGTHHQNASKQNAFGERFHNFLLCLLLFFWNDRFQHHRFQSLL